jgi:hypothetical protein
MNKIKQIYFIGYLGFSLIISIDSVCLASTSQEEKDTLGQRKYYVVEKNSSETVDKKTLTNSNIIKSIECNKPTGQSILGCVTLGLGIGSAIASIATYSYYQRQQSNGTASGKFYSSLLIPVIGFTGVISIPLSTVGIINLIKTKKKFDIYNKCIENYR